MKQESISRALIDPDPDQPRSTIDREELKLFAVNIQNIGLLQPIIVYRIGDRFGLVDGHRRYAATGLIGLTEINCLILDQKPDADTILLTQLAANCMRVDLKPTEKALAFKRLKDSRGWTNVELAKAMSTSKSTVTQTLSYLKLPGELKEKLDAGELAGSTAYAITRASDAESSELISEAVHGRLKRDDANLAVGRKSSGAKGKVRSTFRLEDCDVCIVANERLDPSCSLRRSTPRCHIGRRQLSGRR